MSARIGLEIHAYVLTRSKLFCACDADFLGAREPNTRICPTCTAQPGAKPRAPNRVAVEAGVRLARALGMALAPRAAFLRKHYLYPDSPANFQRTSEPFATGGLLAGVPLTELHLEEDPGALDPATGLVDDNRAGAPLLELVTEPALQDAAHAKRFLRELRLALGYLGIHRDAAGLKADCNVSLEGGARVEVKNVHGARNVERAIESEIRRQEALVAKGERVARETRSFDDASGETRASREKETAADYRFLADPDLRPLDIAAVAARLPAEESPWARRARLAALAGVPEEQASPLVEERALADAFEQAASRGDPALAFRFVTRDLRAELEFRKVRLADAQLSADDVASLVDALARGELQPQAATRVLRAAFDAGDLAGKLAAERAAGAGGDDALDEAVKQALAQNPKAVADWRAGKGSAVNFLVGQAMRRLQGRAEANAVREAVESALRAQ